MKAQRRCLSSDIISTLPADIIEAILCLLPILDAARTSILSRDWRYKWTKISKLVFDDMKFQASTNENANQWPVIDESFDIPDQWLKMYNKCKLFYPTIYQVLLQHQVPITEFTLFASMNARHVGIEQIMLHLSTTNTVKKLRLSYLNTLPLSVFSCHKLTDLYLFDCHIRHQPTFNRLGSLITLHLQYCNISKKKLLYILANCPLLKSLTLLELDHNISCDDASTYIELFECLRALEDFTTYIWSIECFGRCPHPRPRELPTSLLHLKYVCLKAMYAIEKDEYGLPFLVLLIRSSPNLEKLKLTMVTPESYRRYDKVEMDSSYASMVDCSDIRLEHLIELEINNFGNLKPELEFVKIILAKSPVLKKVRIILHEKVANDEELKISRLLLRSPCASPAVKIIVEYRPGRSSPFV